MVVVDSSILIPLARIGKLSLLKRFFEEVKTVRGVYSECVLEATGKPGVSEIKEACNHWIQVVEPPEKVEETAKLEGVEKTDVSLIFFSRQEGDKLLSNDYALILLGRSKGVECWWLTTLILKMVKEKMMEKKEAEQILYDLVRAGMRLKSEVYATILREIQRTT